ncbi:hypothetical protein EXIGLDRAFT_762522 [Exidia glandulosa HHB12029]|uniref:Uncharacterized protein n=1 Tax=Exidia glandulosa HHB12029 TaxID=1314781 RepID=A0A165MRK4_EXIGL|nr:hypothetical protein EXIGLDRAFT_762522 [Exidia glandulosa HHB12029]
MSVTASPQSAALLVREANRLDQAQDVFRDLADLLGIASAFLILHSRRAVRRLPVTKVGWLKPTLDIFLAASFLVTSILAHFTTDVRFWLVVYFYVLVYCIVILDLAVTAFRLRAQVAHDQATDSVACLLVPLWTVDIIFRCLGDRGSWVETLGEKCMVPALTFTIFLSLGNSRSVWKSGE